MNTPSPEGPGALAQQQDLESVLFLDLDDVLTKGDPYDGRHLLLRPQPVDLHSRLWHQPAVEALRAVVQSALPQIVLTTSWLRFLDLSAARRLFEKTGAAFVAERLHPDGEAPQLYGWTRLRAIDAWLTTHAWTAPYVVLDDDISGSGLRDSVHDKDGRLILCEPGRCFLLKDVSRTVHALQKPQRLPKRL